MKKILEKLRVIVGFLVSFSGTMIFLRGCEASLNLGLIDAIPKIFVGWILVGVGIAIMGKG